jgi:hypothetical protein
VRSERRIFGSSLQTPLSSALACPVAFAGRYAAMREPKGKPAGLRRSRPDGIQFDVTREGDHVVWRITGPTSAAATLDALYELPALIGSDERANELWAALDAAACGPGRAE